MDSNLEQMRLAAAGSKAILDLDRAALLVIDMQEYQTRDGSITRVFEAISPEIPAYYLKRVEEIAEPNAIRVLDVFRRHGAPVVFTQFASVKKDESDLLGFCRDSNRMTREVFGEPLIPHIDSEAAALTEAFQPVEGEILLQKTSSGAFIGTGLDELLRERGVEQLVIVGVLTHACVENTARVGIDLDYTVFVVEDACATLDPQLHHNALTAMELLTASIVLADDINGHQKQGSQADHG